MSPKMSSRAESGLIGAVAFLASAVALAMVYVAGRYAWVVGCLIGGVLIAYGARALLRAASVESWLRVRGRILESGLGEQRVPMKTSMRIDYYPVVK